MLEASLRLLHPVMPYLTEELWQRLPGVREAHGETICLAPYPVAVESRIDAELESSMQRLFELVGRVRNIRAELGLPPKTRVDLYLQVEGTELTAWLESQRALLEFLCGLDGLHFGAAPEGASRDRVGSVELGVVAPERELGAEERARLEKEAARLGELIERARRQLANQQFLDKAPDHVIETKRSTLEELESRLATVQVGL